RVEVHDLDERRPETQDVAVAGADDLASLDVGAGRAVPRGERDVVRGFERSGHRREARALLPRAVEGAAEWIDEREPRRNRRRGRGRAERRVAHVDGAAVRAVVAIARTVERDRAARLVELPIEEQPLAARRA